jgi:hypothetical protein
MECLPVRGKLTASPPGSISISSGLDGLAKF